MTVRQLYLSDTAVLVTRFMAPGGVGEVADFMVPIDSPAPTGRHRLIRLARWSGQSGLRARLRPRFDYGRAAHTLTLADEHCALFRGPGTDLCLQSTTGLPLRAEGDDVTARFTLRTGQRPRSC